MPAAWMVRAGKAGYVVDEFEKKGCVAIGWEEMGDLADLRTREHVRKRVEEVYADARPSQREMSISQVSRFLLEIQVGDPVLTYDTGAREYLAGQVAGGYAWKPEYVADHPNTRAVTWRGRVSRDDLSDSSRNTLGSLLAVFAVGDSVWREVQALLQGKRPPARPDGDGKSPQEIFLEMLGRSQEFIKDRIQELSWEQMQDFVAGLLRAMGYKTVVSPPGKDRGKDILASPDGLGLEQPRIRVQVKHRPREKMGTDPVRSFIAALRANDKGLYVSTGGFTGEALYEGERATAPVTLLDLDGLAELLLQVYEKLDVETKALLPLTRFYWPAE